MCMAGRSHDKPHKNMIIEGGPVPSQEEPSSDQTRPAAETDVVGASDGPSASDDPPTGLVPRISIDYFYVSSKSASPVVGPQGMSTRESQPLDPAMC